MSERSEGYRIIVIGMLLLFLFFTQLIWHESPRTIQSEIKSLEYGCHKDCCYSDCDLSSEQACFSDCLNKTLTTYKELMNQTQ